MAVTNRVTMMKFPKADQATEFFNSEDKWFDLESPPGYGWRLEESFLGYNVIYFVWKKGGIQFDSGLVHYWTGYGDDLTTGEFGKGQRLHVVNTVGNSTNYTDIFFIHNDSYLYGGTLSCKGNTMGNEISMEYFASATEIAVDSNGDVEVIDGFIYPSENGTHVINGQYGLIPHDNGDWDYDEDTDTLTPSIIGEGSYKLSIVDVPLARPINQIPITCLNGREQSVIGGNGIALTKGGFFRVTTHNNSDTDWEAYLYFHLCRHSTV